MLRSIIIPWAFLLAGCVQGCSPGATSSIREDIDFSHVRRVGVFPFQNLAQDVHAGSRVQTIFLAEVLENDGLIGVEPGEMLSAMNELRLAPGATLSPEQVVALGQRVGADAVFFGTIEEYGLDRAGRDRVNFLTASFILAETETGTNVWSAQVHEDGTSLWRRLFGTGTASMYDVTRTAVKDALGTLF